MIDVQAGKGVCFEGGFSDFVKFEVGHFGIGGVLDGDHFLAIDLVISHLAEKYAVGTNVLFSAVGGDRFGDEIRGDRAVDEDFFRFLFSHDESKSTDTLYADANAEEGMDHGILKLNAIERNVILFAIESIQKLLFGYS